MKIAYNLGLLNLDAQYTASGLGEVIPDLLSHFAGMIADKDEAERPAASTSITEDISAATVAAVGRADGCTPEISTPQNAAVSDVGAKGAVAQNSYGMARAAKSDEELMLDYAQGDTHAFTHLYGKYRPPLFRFFVAAVNDESLATELYQETWTKVIGASRSYKPKAKFSTWIFTIARNNLRDYYRKFQPHLVEFDTVAEASAVDETNIIDSSVVVELQPDELAILAQQSRTLQLALDRLPLNQKETMLLRYFAGMSIADIAESMDEKPETIKSRLRYATVKLKQDLKNSLAAGNQF